MPLFHDLKIVQIKWSNWGTWELWILLHLFGNVNPDLYHPVTSLGHKELTIYNSSNLSLGRTLLPLSGHIIDSKNMSTFSVVCFVSLSIWCVYVFSTVYWSSAVWLFFTFSGSFSWIMIDVWQQIGNCITWVIWFWWINAAKKAWWNLDMGGLSHY